MSNENAKWTEAVRGEFDADAAEQLIQVIEGVLAEDSNEILRQITAELVIGLREMRNLTRRIEQECSPAARQTVLFETGTGDERTPVTVDAYSQTILSRVAECRELLNFLTYYVMALGEKGESAPRFP